MNQQIIPTGSAPIVAIPDSKPQFIIARRTIHDTSTETNNRDQGRFHRQHVVH